MEDTPHGVQVLRVESRAHEPEGDHEDVELESSAYKLDEAALAAILLREDVADCPVAVVSVAGAYRGGKSFLLDFLLRYLFAEPSQRSDGSWVGGKDEPLRGFSWRGGCERDTTGLLLWSRPAHLTLPSGQTVAVLLMDTQGSFDSGSTVRDCSTVFALSTLLASAQLYNLSDNIREDDLQHLQLFTEYGRLALESNEGLKPFQSLKFLIRDWQFPYEHAYGAQGGRHLLDKRLKIERSQAQELQDLRQHIRACYESVECFLMPHPGFAVCDSDFQGCVAAINDDFIDALLQLVPSIFEPASMMPKVMNGEMVKGRDLFHYFKKYVDVFNSSELPKPQSIMMATAEAAMLSAIETARAQFVEAMERSCGAQRPRMSAAMLRAAHARARDDALRAFRARKSMGDQHARGELLAQDLDCQLEQYELINEAKYHKALANAKKAYEEVYKSETIPETLCLHPQDLDEVQRKAVEAAVTLFNSKRVVEDTEDEEIEGLLKDLDERFKQFKTLNDRINNAAVMEAREDYSAFVQCACGDQPCMATRVLDLKDEEGRERATALFDSYRNRATECASDPYKEQLYKDIESKYVTLQNLNRENNETAVAAAKFHYEDSMRSLHSPDLCLHPDAFREGHEDARERALNEFRSKRLPGDADDQDDEYILKIILHIESRYTELSARNDWMNESAVAVGYAAYSGAMDASMSAYRLRFRSHYLRRIHDEAFNSGLQVFNAKRQPHGNRIDDYRVRLSELIQNRYKHYKTIHNAIVTDEPSVLERTAVAGAAAVVAAGAVVAVAATGGVAALAAAATITTVEAGCVAGAVAVTAATGAGTVVAATWADVKAYLIYYAAVATEIVLLAPLRVEQPFSDVNVDDVTEDSPRPLGVGPIEIPAETNGDQCQNEGSVLLMLELETEWPGSLESESERAISSVNIANIVGENENGSSLSPLLGPKKETQLLGDQTKGRVEIADSSDVLPQTSQEPEDELRVLDHQCEEDSFVLAASASSNTAPNTFSV